MTDRYDVVVVGAGPAGSATARDLAGAGVRTLLLEHHPVVGRPVQCSGFVSPRTLDLAGVRPEEVVLEEVRGAWVHTPRGARLQIGGARTYGYAMDRMRFDQLLAEQAAAAGAELQTEAHFDRFERTPGGVSVHFTQRGQSRSVHTSLLVGADGVHSTVGRQLGRGLPSQVVHALGAEVPRGPADRGMVDLFVGNEIAPGWFGWAIPLGEARVRIGVGTTSPAAPAELLAAMRRTFPELLPDDPVPGTYSAGLIPLWEPGRASADHVMLVGDAAWQVKPSTGGGIHSGLVGAKHCAAQARQALETGAFGREALAGYEERWEQELGGEFRDLRRLRTLFTSLGDRGVDWALRLLSRPALQRVIAREGDIDFPAAMFASLARSAPEILTGLPMPWVDWAMRRLKLGARAAATAVAD